MPDSTLTTTLAAVIAIGLALQAGLGGTLMYMVEAFKSALGERATKYAGLMSLGLGMILGAALGVVAAAFTDNTSMAWYGVFGGFAGLLAGAGGIQSFKAAGSVNTKTSAAIDAVSATTKDYESAFSYPIYGGVDSVEEASTPPEEEEEEEIPDLGPDSYEVGDPEPVQKAADTTLTQVPLPAPETNRA